MYPSMNPVLWNPLWNADVGRAASLSKQVYERASTALRTWAASVVLTKKLWTLDSQLASLLETFYRAAEHPAVVEPVS